MPLLINHEQYEGYMFSNQSETTMEEETTDLENLFPNANATFFARLYELYPASEFNNTFWQRQQIFGDFIINCPTYYMASASASRKLPTWKMIFDAGTKVHNAIQPFLFGDPQLIENAASGMVLKDWVLSFAITMDPNLRSFTTTTKPFWPQYRSGNLSNHTVIKVQTSGIRLAKDEDASPRCDFWHSQSQITQQ